MKRKILLVLAISLSSAALYAQTGNVGIGITTPHANALLELNSNSKGLLPTRLTTAQRDAITPKPEGLVIYNLDDHCLQYWNGTQWNGNCSGTPVPPPAPDLTATCTGAYLPYTASGGIANITVNGIAVTASFSAYTNVNTFSPSVTSCGVTTTAPNTFWLSQNDIASSMKINFSTSVSNLKLYITTSHINEQYTFTLKKAGAIVSPTYTVSPVGTCNGNFTINSVANTITNTAASSASGIIVNLGGVWFDEIVVGSTDTTDPSTGGSLFNFCVGAAQ